MNVLTGLERVHRALGRLERGAGCGRSMPPALAAALVAIMFTDAIADPHPVADPPIFIDLLPAPTPQVLLSLSESDTNPYDHFGTPVAGLRDIFLWVDCTESVAAVHAKLEHSFLFASFTSATPEIIGGGGGNDVRLFMNGCVDDFPYLLGKFSVFDTGGGGTACLTPVSTLGTLGTGTCDFPFPQYAPAKVRPFFAYPDFPTFVPCYIPRSCYQMAVAGRGLRTRGAGPGEFVALGLMLPSNSAIASVDWASVVYAGTETPLAQITYIRNAATEASFAAVEAGNWTAFSAMVSDSIPPDVDVDVVFDITPSPGATEAEIAAVLQSSKIGTDHADGSGAIVGGDDLDIVTPFVPLSAPAALASVGRLFHPAEPNPLAGSTTLRFDLPRASSVSLRILDVAGRVVRHLDTSQRTAGAHAVVWDSRDGKGGSVAPGVYFAELNAGGARETQKLTLIR